MHKVGGLQARFLIESFLLSRTMSLEEELRSSTKSSSQSTLTSSQSTKHQGFESNGYLNIQQEKSADEVVARLKEKGIGCARTYPQTLDMQAMAIALRFRQRIVYSVRTL